jgi:hypothetical protein
MEQETIAVYHYEKRSIMIVAYYMSEKDHDNRVVNHYHVWEGMHCLSAADPIHLDIPSWDDVYSEYYLAFPENKE